VVEAWRLGDPGRGGVGRASESGAPGGRSRGGRPGGAGIPGGAESGGRRSPEPLAAYPGAEALAAGDGSGYQELLADRYQELLAEADDDGERGSDGRRRGQGNRAGTKEIDGAETENWIEIKHELRRAGERQNLCSDTMLSFMH
jgi:hypothetical protein